MVVVVCHVRNTSIAVTSDMFTANNKERARRNWTYTEEGILRCGYTHQQTKLEHAEKCTDCFL